MEKSLDTVVVKLKKYDAEMSSFVRLRIPLNTVEELSIKKKIDPRTFYVRHGLEPCSPLDLVYVDGPFSTNNAEVLSSDDAVSIRSFIYSFANHSPLYLVADLSQSPPEWNASNLPFKMTITDLLSLDEKIYVFGYEKPGVFSAYTFDLDRREWERLSLPVPDDFYESRFVVVSLAKMILTLHVDHGLQFVYDPRLRKWSSVDYKNLLPLFCSIVDYPMTVDEHNSFYWLDSKANNIRAFDYQLCKHYVGPIVGFAHKPIVPNAAQLIHVMGWIFGLVWKEHDNSIVWKEDGGYVWKEDDSNLHLTLVHISHGSKASGSSNVDDHHLFVNVVSCFCHPIDSDLMLEGAYKLE